MADAVIDETILPRGWIPRERAIHRKMSFEQFERNIPFRPGWKREYYGGKAHVRPSWPCVHFHCDIGPTPVPRMKGFRTPSRDDAGELALCFFDSFRLSPQYADYPMAGYRRMTVQYINNFYGDVRGAIHPSSTIVGSGRTILAAVLIKVENGKLPLVDCVFTRPSHMRQGLARKAARRAFAMLARDGFRKVRSIAMLANEASIQWHLSAGFRELPDEMQMEMRARFVLYELDRLKEVGQISESEYDVRKTEAVRLWRRAEKQGREGLKRDYNHNRFYYEYGYWPKQNGDLA